MLLHQHYQRIASFEDPAKIVNPASNSTTWSSGGSWGRTRLQRLHNIGNHIGVTASPFFPKTIQDFNLHNALYKQDITAVEKKRLEGLLAVQDGTTQQLDDIGVGGEGREMERVKVKVGLLMDGRNLENGPDMTAVLAMKSIWAPLEVDEEGGTDEGGTDEGWPCREEFKWEGEEHLKQGLARRFPLAREEKLMAADRLIMILAGVSDDVAEMERGEKPMPFRMKEVKGVQVFDETAMGNWDRAVMGFREWEPTNLEKGEEITDEEALEKGLLSKVLLDEF